MCYSKTRLWGGYTTWPKSKSRGYSKRYGNAVFVSIWLRLRFHTCTSYGEWRPGWLFTITQLEPSPRFPSNITVISNTLLTASMVLQDSMNYSSFRWRRIVRDCIDEIRSVLEVGGTPYQDSLFKLAAMSRTGHFTKHNPTIAQCVQTLRF